MASRPALYRRSELLQIPILLALLLFCGKPAKAGAALFLEEPYGRFGHMNPTGHAAVYLSHVCAASPVRLRPCEPGESGVVISRYYHVGGYDWVAIPLIAYLYAVDRPEQVPLYATARTVDGLRDNYRREHLEEIVPDGPGGKTPQGDWTQLVGEAYDRKIYSFEIETTRAQDDRLIAKLNASKNISHFNLIFHNCADFARGVLNTYYPHATHRSLFADQGITTPKQVAKSLVSYSKHHADLQFSCFVIDQVPGTLPRSGPVRGVFEAFLKSKKYLLPVVALHPLIAGGMLVTYVAMARLDPHRQFDRHLEGESEPEVILAELLSNGVGRTSGPLTLEPAQMGE
ncbi:MAG TPA: hypothetical protein VMU80_01325 [Bryobacteraceae bacterium]|nr:hypothetical protein [Bryobacteraceae bacterium]